MDAKQLKARDSSGYATLVLNAQLDHSGITPHALDLLTTLAAALPFEEAARIARKFNLPISSSELERLIAPLARSCSTLTQQRLRTASEDTPPTTSGPGRVWVLECDGVMVLGKPLAGCCDGIEIKQVALYRYASPSERFVVADVIGAEALREAVLGLLRAAGVTAGDTLVGVGDGAVWVEATLDGVCDVSITDVFHAAQYLEVVLLALGWSDARRVSTRRAFCRGEIDVAAFLCEHLPTPEEWLSWERDAVDAVRYLESRTQRMRYPAFRELGYPIGSGVIEGLNKSVIGSRMKRSGMQWSRSGAGRMAALRAWMCSKRAVVTFDELRQHAYPPPSVHPVPLSA